MKGEDAWRAAAAPSAPWESLPARRSFQAQEGKKIKKLIALLLFRLLVITLGKITVGFRV